MKTIWAPWRSKFIYQRKRGTCIFCKARLSRNMKKSLIIKKTEHSFSMLNMYPYNNGHIMVAPKRHKPSLETLSLPELTDLMLLLNTTTKLLSKVIKPDGYNIGLNIGKISGAGFPGHVHIHIVPRWEGDTNFMPVLTDVKVISESLGSLYERLIKHAS